MNPLQRNLKNILVTGGAGFIGSAFIRYLLAPEREFKGNCINLDALTYAGNLQNLASVAKDPRYVFIKGDICDEALLEKICTTYNIDTIIHFAAESHVDRSIVEPKAFFETNIRGTFSLLEVVKKRPHIHFHHVSTDEVYGSLGETGFFTEETAYHPNSPYSASKAASDHLVRAYGHTYQLSTIISNCSNNYGPFHFPEKFIPLLILNCLARKSLPIYGQGLQIRDWLYVEDHAAALYLLLHYGRKSETYNIGGEAEWKNIDVAHEIIRIIADMQEISSEQLKSLIIFVKDRPGHDLRYAIDCTKIKTELKWKPAYTFHKGIKKTIVWYMQNEAWITGIKTGAYQKWIESHYTSRLNEPLLL